MALDKYAGKKNFYGSNLEICFLAQKKKRGKGNDMV